MGLPLLCLASHFSKANEWMSWKGDSSSITGLSVSLSVSLLNKDELAVVMSRANTTQARAGPMGAGGYLIKSNLIISSHRNEQAKQATLAAVCVSS